MSVFHFYCSVLSICEDAGIVDLPGEGDVVTRLEDALVAGRLTDNASPDSRNPDPVAHGVPDVGGVFYHTVNGRDDL
jgi:hypothetical protein